MGTVLEGIGFIGGKLPYMCFIEAIDLFGISVVEMHCHIIQGN